MELERSYLTEGRSGNREKASPISVDA